MVPKLKFAEIKLDSPKLPGMCSRWIESSTYTCRCRDTLTDTHTHNTLNPRTDRRSSFHLYLTTQGLGPPGQGLLLNATLNLIWWDANCGAVGKCWRHFDFRSPTALMKKYQLSICKTFLRWTPYKLLRCNLCTVSSLFNGEICLNSDWADFPKAGSEGYFLMSFGSSNLSNTFLNYSRLCWGWTWEQSPGSTAERLTELPAGKV